MTLPLKAADLAHWDVTRDKWVVESSVYDILIGASSGDIRQTHRDARCAGETIPARDLSVETRAENFDGYAPAVRLVDESKAAGTVVGACRPATGWSSRAPQLNGGTAFTARTAKGTTGAGTVEVRLDSPTGQLLGTAQVAATGNVYTYARTTATLTAASGTARRLPRALRRRPARHILYSVRGVPRPPDWSSGGRGPAPSAEGHA